MNMITLKIENLDKTKDFAQKLARYFCCKGGIIFLDGDLGAGKTTFTQFFAKEIGIDEIVTSPTFNIFKRYENNSISLNHFDLYRIRDAVYDQGFEEYWFSNDITIIEWSVYLPDEFKNIANLRMNISSVNECERLIEINADSEVAAYIKEQFNELIC